MNSPDQTGYARGVGARNEINARLAHSLGEHLQELELCFEAALPFDVVLFFHSIWLRGAR